jgi:hypothetical protein
MKNVLLWFLVLSVIAQLPRPVAVAQSWDHLEITDVRFEIDHIYIDLRNNGSEVITLTKCDIIWVAEEYQVAPSTVAENGTSQGLPISIPGDATITLDISCNWVPGCYYQVEIRASDQSGFSRDLGCAPTSVSGMLLYKVNVNFYLLSGESKVDVDIGNCGTQEANVTELYVWGSIDEPLNLLSAPLRIRANGRSRVTLLYDWAPGEIYRFKVVTDSGRSSSWTQQAPVWEQDEAKDPVILHFFSKNMTVEKNDIFAVDVMIENIPEHHGVAGIQFDVAWDSSALEALNMTEVMFHSAAPPEEQDNIWKLAHRISNQSFEYAYTWMDLSRAIEGGYAPTWGCQTLATVTFKAIETGSATLHFSLVEMGDIQAGALVYSVDEPKASGRKCTSLLNCMLVDYKVNVEDVNSVDKITNPDESEDKSQTILAPTTPVNVPNSAPPAYDFVRIIVVVAAFAGVMVPTSIVANRRRKRNAMRIS